MDVDDALSTVLQSIAAGGPASLESLLDRLPLVRPGDVARGFQAARADGLIEAIPDRFSRGEPVYALTRAGEAALPAAGAERRDQVRASGGAIAVEAVLGVVAEFTEASIGLVAWELCMREDQILAVWQRAFDEGLLENSAYDAVHNEQMARLTARGTERLAVVDEMTG